jgi:hypothetical protein
MLKLCVCAPLDNAYTAVSPHRPQLAIEADAITRINQSATQKVVL